MTPNDSLQQTLMPESVQTPLGTVANSASEHQSEVLGLWRLCQFHCRPAQLPSSSLLLE